MSFKEVLKEVYQKLNFLGNIAIALCIVTIIIQFINKDTFKNTQQKRNLQSNDLILLFEKLNRSRLILPILWTTNITFLVEIRKVILSLFHQEKRKWALLESNLLGIS
jgi:hypothetical protein